MEAQPDFKDLLALFNKHRVEYLIAGAYALAFHGAPRYTGDIDLLVRSSEENAARILQALEEFGFGSVGITPEDFVKPSMVIQLGVAPARVDLLTSLTGVEETDAFAGRVAGSYGDIPVHYLGREQFIANKRALGRRKDLADLEALGIIE
jgi:hypothetical protein